MLMTRLVIKNNKGEMRKVRESRDSVESRSSFAFRLAYYELLLVALERRVSFAVLEPGLDFFCLLMLTFPSLRIEATQTSREDVFARASQMKTKRIASTKSSLAFY